ncbi:MAG: hypothetical protein AAB546_02345 [Patescibacteria group bacterium]
MNKSQLKAVSDFFTNSAVAWFAAGFISPLFSKNENLEIMLISLLLGIMAACIFMIFSLTIVREEHQS